jgi:hypothetical protein
MFIVTIRNILMNFSLLFRRPVVMLRTMKTGRAFVHAKYLLDDRRQVNGFYSSVTVLY